MAGNQGRPCDNGACLQYDGSGRRPQTNFQDDEEDLERARAAWIEGAKKNKKERKRREESDYLQYQDEQGLYADFHANRHTFISNLAKSGVSPKVAQTMARHSDINLTMNVYSHVKMDEQTAAISVLPSPPNPDATGKRKTRKNAGLIAIPLLPKFAHRFAQTLDFGGHLWSSLVTRATFDHLSTETKKPLVFQGFFTLSHRYSPVVTSSGGGTRTPDTRIMIPLL